MTVRFARAVLFDRKAVFAAERPTKSDPTEKGKLRRRAMCPAGLGKEKQMEKLLFTSESVTEGHPDKMCDQISDAILDALMEQDPMSRVACETCCTTGMVMVMGEITTKAYVDIPKIVRDTVREIGYTRGKYGFDADTCGVITTIDEQSADIALGVDKALEAKENKM